MPMFSLEKLDAILQCYASEAPFIMPHTPEEITRMKSPFSNLLNIHGAKLHRVSTLGIEAMQFIDLAQERYYHSTLSPPLAKTKIQSIYTYFDSINKDLLGSKEGSQEEQICAQEWEQYWEIFRKDNQLQGKQLTENELAIEQAALLTAYREKTIRLCLFKPKGWQTHEMDEIRAQDFLSEINQCYAHTSPPKAFQQLYQKYQQELTRFLCLDLQALSRYLSLGQQTEYVKKFEEILNRKSVEFVGLKAKSILFKEITKDNEFLNQLPLLLEKSETLKRFILEHRKMISSKIH